MQRFDKDRFNVKNPKEIKGKEECRSQIPNRFAGLEKSDDDVDINRCWETISDNIEISTRESLGYYELKQHKPRFDG
jgi:hypothetical protein